MSKESEINYLKKIGKKGIESAVNKPFSDEDCSTLLFQIGTILALLPPPPAKLLDLGCGTGWTSIFFAKTGYDVVGQDISKDMIHWANVKKRDESLKNLNFVCSDYEELDFLNQFDIAVFLSSLHHAQDEEKAIRSVYRSLKPGGICVTLEPGVGHTKAPHSIRAVEEYGVTEKDMPPKLIKRFGIKAGFSKINIYPNVYYFPKIFLGKEPENPLFKYIPSIPIFSYISKLLRFFIHQIRKYNSGVVVMKK